jgi:hypothetical protein
MKVHDLFRTANVATILSLISLGAGVSCASGGDGTGSESHFACQKDEDCAKHGASLVCIDRECFENGSAGESGETLEPAPFGMQTLPPLAIEAACGSYSLGARLEAAETFVRLARQRRKELTDACAALSHEAAPAAPKDADATRLCGAAKAAVAKMLAGKGLTGASREPLWIDADAQFTCEQEAAAAAGCSCGPYTLEGRCPTTDWATLGCAAQCKGACFGGGPFMCQGTCGGACDGTCDGDCSVRSGPDCLGACQGVCTGACTGSCTSAVPLSCDGVCVGECSVPVPITGCAAPLKSTACCPAAFDAYPACKALGILRGGTGRAVLSRAGSEFRSQSLLSLHQVLMSLANLTLAADSVSSVLPSVSNLPDPCNEEIGLRLITLAKEISDANTTIEVLIGAMADVVSAEIPR